MIKLVETMDELKQFVLLPKSLYRGHKHYVFPLFKILQKELKALIFEKKTYQAILAYKNNKVVGRLLFTYDISKHKQSEVCYFSMLDMIDDIEVTASLFDFVYQDMKQKHIPYLEGTFSPYDPDTRRGILVKGYDSDPVLFTSYHEPYYKHHLESLGFYKAFDTLLLDGGEINLKNEQLLKRLYDFTVASQHIQIDYLNMKNIDKEIDDIMIVLNEAHNEIIYQEPPTKEMLYTALKQMKSFINPKFVTIAREIKTQKPIGFAMILPDFNQVIKKTKGNIFLFPLINKRKITQAIGKLQYIVPKYQDKGVLAAMYYKEIVQLRKFKISSIEMGTIMEDNYKSFHHFLRFGGSIKKVYRLYGKDIQL
ncbi:MAG: hypothetical protein AB7E61_01225 [Acholeplasmataceae bacterium]